MITHSIRRLTARVCSILGGNVLPVYVCIASGLFSGCTIRKVEHNGARYVHRSFGTKQSIGKLTMLVTSNSAAVTVENYASDQVQAIEVAIKAAVSAAVQGAKP